MTHRAIIATAFFMSMLMSACRTSKETLHEENSALMTETSLTRADSSSSWERILSLMSFSADSIVLWFAPHRFDSEIDFGMFDRTTTGMKNDSSLQLAASSPGGKPAGAQSVVPNISKVKLAGVSLTEQKINERSATHASADTLKKHSSADEQFSEQRSRKQRPPSLLWMLAAAGLAAILACAYYLYKRIARS